MISGALSSLSGLSNVAKKTASSASAAVQSVTGSTTPQTPESTAAMRDILTQYDVTNISPNDFSTMIQQLAEKGAISQKDLQDLSSIRSELDSSGAAPDKPINVLDFYRQQVQKIQTTATGQDPATAQQTLGPMLQRLGWLEKFSLGHSQPDAIGMNTTV
jgi:hypothetical protein